MAVAPSNFASAAGNTVACTINVGDLVIVFADNQDNTVPGGVSDNGAGGGNRYSVSNSSTFGGSIGAFTIWICNKATVAATSVSFTGGHVPGVGVATFTGATGIRHVGQVSGTGSASTGSIASLNPNSYVLASIAYWKSATNVTASAGTGTLQVQATSNGSSNPGIAFVTMLAATAGSFSPSVNFSAASTNFNVDQLEVWSATYDSYFSKLPLLERQVPLYKLVPLYGGATGGPVTPVPVAVVLKSGTLATAYSETLSAQGGTAPYTFSLLSGSLPTGTTLSGAVISGTPTVAGTYSFVIRVFDSLLNSGSQAFQITIDTPSTSGGAFAWTA